ncbi:hypothetical protein BN982_03235 [Halobacillus karajensis]|uniref:Uncharacterized protein n=1 Tax=Halobacillus karajensis TaxID=195088 RepID=A0A024P462_9BACI|nr:hypothetical protein BN982_03235 [Halobacillus karajensis]CDQ23650.1 hypothetical protein BN983_01901 [Halobacillus karajensis]CDQ27128.1 hypothetical protein BN981_01382 [Halobacillus karajensis]
MKVEGKENLIGDKKHKYTHIQNNSNKVCFMFSGAGYTYDKPLFYYSTMKFIEDKVDIVHVHYNYSKTVGMGVFNALLPNFQRGSAQ